MADKNGRERLSLYFSTKNKKEAEMWEYLDKKYSKSAFVKEAIEEKILREKIGQTSTIINQTLVKKEGINAHKKLKKSDVDPSCISM